MPICMHACMPVANGHFKTLRKGPHSLYGSIFSDSDRILRRSFQERFQHVSAIHGGRKNFTVLSLGTRHSKVLHKADTLQVVVPVKAGSYAAAVFAVA